MCSLSTFELQTEMGSAIAAAASREDSSVEQFGCQPRCLPQLHSCRKRRGSQKRQGPWFHEDIWISIMSCLDAKSLLRLAVTNHQFCTLAKNEIIWKGMCLRELGLPLINIRPAFSWTSLYMAAFDGSHSFTRQQSEKHIDWMRVGVFCLDSGYAIATDRLLEPEQSSEKTALQIYSERMEPYAVTNVKRGIWIADLHLVRCPVCNLAACEGTMQALDARHWELFLHEEYKGCEWEMEQVCSRIMGGHCTQAAACIFDANHYRSKETKGLLDVKAWSAPSGIWQPMSHISRYGAAACTNLQPNQGLQVNILTMKAGIEGPVVGIRVCQQLV